jgi:formylglycine-generating enzyme required for sulfatase activity
LLSRLGLAARGGSSERFVTGPELKPVGVNGFGLSGIHGGVAEIVAGCWSATLREVPGDAAEATRRGNCALRVVRDGTAGEPDTSRRLSARRSIGAREALDHVGFRVARDL